MEFDRNKAQQKAEKMAKNFDAKEAGSLLKNIPAKSGTKTSNCFMT